MAAFPFPRATHFDHTLAFVREGYRYISDHCKALNSDVFETRLLFERTLCLRGAEAARLFYDETLFERRDATPQRVRRTLFGVGGVQGLDDAPHRLRKRMFMGLMRPEEIDRLGNISLVHWHAAAATWPEQPQVCLLGAARKVLLRSACEWTGVPLAEAEIDTRVRDLAAMIEGGSKVGIPYWRGKRARANSEAWLAEVVSRARRAPGASDGAAADDGNALRRIAMHRDWNGDLLEPRVAAVELLNLLRPIVAVAWYVVFCALALHRNPLSAGQIRRSGDPYLSMFVQEVRRFYPFFPAVAARVRESFDWRGYRFAKGTRVLLDLYGTNHDAAIWARPEKFRPERFLARGDNAFDFIPQGGGKHETGHRCAGEWATIALMKAATCFLVREVEYTVPQQNLSVSLRRMPASPASGFVIRDVHRTSRRRDATRSEQRAAPGAFVRGQICSP